MAQYEPGELLGIRHFGRRDQTNAWPLRRAGHLDAGLDRQILAHGEDVEAGVIDRPLKVDDAALDAELLPIGVEAAVDGANRSAGTRQTGVVGAHANLSGQPAFDARTAEMNAAAKCRLDVETQAAHDLALANSVSGCLLPADDDVVRQARPPRLGQRPQAGIDAQLAAHIERLLAHAQLAIAGKRDPLVGALHHAEAIEADIQACVAPPRGGGEIQFAAGFDPPRLAGEAGGVDVLVEFQHLRQGRKLAVENQLAQQETVRRNLDQRPPAFQAHAEVERAQRQRVAAPFAAQLRLPRAAAEAHFAVQTAGRLPAFAYERPEPADIRHACLQTPHPGRRRIDQCGDAAVRPARARRREVGADFAQARAAQLRHGDQPPLAQAGLHTRLAQAERQIAKHEIATFAPDADASDGKCRRLAVKHKRPVAGEHQGLRIRCAERRQPSVQRRKLGEERLRANLLPTPGALPAALVQRELFEAQIADEPVEGCRAEGDGRSGNAQCSRFDQVQQGCAARRLPAAEVQFAQHAAPGERRSGA